MMIRLEFGLSKLVMMQSAGQKVVGKLLAHPFPKAKKLVIDSSEIRGAGQRVQGYGWISVGDRPFQDALMNICKSLNKRASIYLQGRHC